MIDPQQITKYDRTEAELQEFLLFCLLVQGKKASVQAVKLEHFLIYLSEITHCRMPFQMVNIALNWEYEEGEEEDGETEPNLLWKAMKKFGLGQYNRLQQAIEDLLKLPPLSEVTVEQLENCYGVGPKSARFFVVHSRANVNNHAILDTHILKWLRQNGVTDAPKLTPSGKWYTHYENIFLTFVRASGLSVAEFDLNIWKSFAV